MIEQAGVEASIEELNSMHFKLIQLCFTGSEHEREITDQLKETFKTIKILEEQLQETIEKIRGLDEIKRNNSPSP